MDCKCEIFDTDDKCINCGKLYEGLVRTDIVILEYRDVYDGLAVYDIDFRCIGVVKNCSDIHNIHVEYDGGGSGLYCLDKAGDDYDALYVIVYI